MTQGVAVSPSFERVEMVERAPALAVDAAMAFVDDHHVEVAGRVFLILVDQRSASVTIVIRFSS